MTKRLSTASILEILKNGNFAEIEGTIEDSQIEFKDSPYQLTNDLMKCELAKDVSALANADGGLILVGFRTEKDKDSSVEYVDKCRPFEPSLLDPDQYRKVLDTWISPNVKGVDIKLFDASSETGKFVAAIVVPTVAQEQKPYIVNRSIDADGRVRGQQFGYYERIQDRIPPISAETIRTYLRDGMRFAEISRRLDTIEAFLGRSTSTSVPPQVDLDISSRISDAILAVDRSSYANIILAAASQERCTFPDLFSSGSALIVRLLEDPPVIRKEGFAITPRGRNRPSEIVLGKSRRVVARGDRITEVWQDGVLVAVGPGDDDMLCWFMRNQRQPKPGLPIRNFVLTEVTLNFCRFAVELFKFAAPMPRTMKFFLKLDNMSEDGVPCTLSTNDDREPYGIGHSFNARKATGPVISCEFETGTKDIDVGHVVYQLLGRLYVAFGFNFDEMPYIEYDQLRITPESFFPNLRK